MQSIEYFIELAIYSENTFNRTKQQDKDKYYRLWVNDMREVLKKNNINPLTVLKFLLNE